MGRETVIPYFPRRAFRSFHARTQRWSALICHRRAGKTVAAINDLQIKALECTQPHPRFAFMAPTRVRAKEIAWEYLKRYSAPLKPKISESELYVQYPHNNARVTVYGADNDRAMGLYLDGIVYDECDEIPPRVHDIVAPALADRKGWAVWMGVLKGRHNLWKRLDEHRTDPAWFTLSLRASQSEILDPEELVSLRDQMGESAYALQMEIDVNASIANAIYGQEMDFVRKESRLCPLALDPTVPIDWFFDIGHSLRGDDWSLWGCQFQGRDILLQTYYARTGHIPSHYAEHLIRFCDHSKLRLGTVYLPHDGSRMDRHGRSAEDDLRAAGIPRIKIVPRTPNLWDSINDLRGLFPRVYIDSSRCTQGWTLAEIEMPSGVDCLDYYTKKEDQTTGIILDVPVHNQYSHGCDALRTLVEALKLRLIEGESSLARDTRNKPVVVHRGGGVLPFVKERRRHLNVMR
jgi:hypothetical protein